MEHVGKRRVLVIGGQFTGIFVARYLRKQFHVTIVDAKEFFEYTPGVLRAFVKPAHFNALTFTLQPVLERKLGVKFIWGEVKSLDSSRKTARIKTPFCKDIDVVGFDYCVICSGCNFGPFDPMGLSLWCPVVHENSRGASKWAHLDERFLEGRRRHILQEFHQLDRLNSCEGEVLIIGAGFIGVEWATELVHFFPRLKITIMDQHPRCLGPLPESAAEYCMQYMKAAGVQQFYGIKYSPKCEDFWQQIGLPDGPPLSYVCIGWKASNYFMPDCVLSDKGPGGGGWILFNKFMQVVQKPMRFVDQTCAGMQADKKTPRETSEVWGDGSIFAVGDCTLGCIGEPPNFEMVPVPKTVYPGEEQASLVVKNVRRLDAQRYSQRNCLQWRSRSQVLSATWWPWGAGIYSINLGLSDGCFVTSATHTRGSGRLICWGYIAAIQKKIIETTKMDACKGRHVGRFIWHLVHFAPAHLWDDCMWSP